MKETIKDKVLKILRKDGQIDNFYCIDNRLTIRLGDVIFRLQKEGKIVLEQSKCGYIEGTKNYRYVIQPLKPKEVKEYWVGGELKATTTIW